jgi:small subunit ribosomal protein S16
MLTIRLSRVGKKKAPIYRVVVMPRHNDPWAKTTEILGHYNPLKTPKELVVKEDRIKYWMQQGAEPSDTVWNLFITHKLIEGEKRNITHISGKRKAETEKAQAEVKAKDEAAKAKVEAEKAKASEQKALADATPVEPPATE